VQKNPAKAPKKGASKALPAPKAPRSSVYSVAERAGVSPGTVSRVLNNRGRVLEATRGRVLAAARELGFKAPIRARQIAVLCQADLHTLRDGTYARALGGQIAMALCRHGMAMVTPRGPLDALANVFLDGILVIGQVAGFEPVAARLLPHTPVVFIDDFSGDPSRYVVRSDHAGAGRLAARRFAETGRKRLAYVGTHHAADAVRMEGYRAGIAEAGLEVIPELLVQRGGEVSFYAAISRVVRLGADALHVPGSSYESLEALNVMNNVMRLAIPKEIALIGGEVPAVSEFLTPPMTTVEEPLAAMGDRAVEMLVGLMAGEEPEEKQVTLPVRFLARESA